MAYEQFNRNDVICNTIAFRPSLVDHIWPSNSTWFDPFDQTSMRSYYYKVNILLLLIRVALKKTHLGKNNEKTA